MRPEALLAEPLTRAWTGATLWSLALFALALAGLGSRIAPAGPAVIDRALPGVPAAAPERLETLERYAEISQRPILFPERQPQPFTLVDETVEAPPQTFDYVLTGVVRSARLQLATLVPEAGGDPVRVRLGEAPAEAPDFRLVRLQPRGAVFEGPSGEVALELRVAGSDPDAVAALQSRIAEGEAVEAGHMPDASDPSMAQVANAPAADAQAAAADASAAAAQPAADPGQPDQAQIDAIRQRIEARRAQLRQAAPVATPPKQSP